MEGLEMETKKSKEIEEVIAKAIKKVGAKKENELCKYLPGEKGGYMHHFTMRKMKLKQPQQLASIIEKNVLQTDRVMALAPKQRAPRGSRKRREHLNFSRNQLERLLTIARMTGDKEIVSMLSPRKSLAAAKRELIQSIRHNKVEQELWNSYTESAQAHQLLNAPLASASK